MRRLLVWAHRWVALALGAWFVLLGLSGAAMVWRNELDAWLNPAWFEPLPACEAATTQPVSRALEVFATAAGGAQASMVTTPQSRGAAYVVWERQVAGGAARRPHFIDVSCRRYLGSREWGAARLDHAHLVPALYELHRSLLARETGRAVVGIGGLVLLAVAITGAVAAWPRGSSRQAWVRALTIKRDASAPRLLYDLHRAGGLWLLPFLVLMTVTGAYLCFPQQGRAIVASMLPTLDGGLQRMPASAPLGTATVQTPDALAATAQALWPDAQWSRIQLPDAKRPYYEVRLLQRGEPRADTGDTRVRMTAQAQVLAVRDALSAPAGETLMGWLFPLHSAEALGWAGRLAWSVFGIGPGLLFATGAWLWWRRRRTAQPQPSLTTTTGDPSNHALRSHVRPTHNPARRRHQPRLGGVGGTRPR